MSRSVPLVQRRTCSRMCLELHRQRERGREREKEREGVTTDVGVGGQSEWQESKNGVGLNRDVAFTHSLRWLSILIEKTDDIFQYTPCSASLSHIIIGNVIMPLKQSKHAAHCPRLWCKPECWKPFIHKAVQSGESDLGFVTENRIWTEKNTVWK